MKRLLKKLFKSTAAQILAGRLIGMYTALAQVTASVTEENAHYPKAYWDADKPVIVAVWHGRLLLMPCFFAHCPHTVHALISAHRDGRLVSYAAQWHGIKTVQGSSTRGGAGAVKALLRLAKAGETLFITPDGPKGPRMHAQDGVLEIARMSGLPILPVSISTSAGKQVKSWDRFLIARPFSRVRIVWGEPMVIPRDSTDINALRTELEARMTAAQNAADDATGRPHTEPAA
ncbi:MAG: DUF374 domain-containing protein [Proteobacteria bacterium]|nr:DUF374 domain-containing protein [Pseudomonadota bacterium]